MDMVERILREATAKSKDGRIDQSDFLNHAAASSRYSLFTPMEASIIFHFAGRGRSDQRLSLLDFGQLLDPRWQAPHEDSDAPAIKASFFQNVAHSAYNFVQGGLAGATGATIVYPIDMGEYWCMYSKQRCPNSFLSLIVKVNDIILVQVALLIVIGGFVNRLGTLGWFRFLIYNLCSL